MDSHSPIRIALVGAGIFATEAHRPALLALSDQFQVVAVCSRNAEKARAFAEAFPQAPAIYTDYATLLAQPDIEALDLVLPIHALPQAVQMGLAAGKHLISEKPIAPNLDIGAALLAEYEAEYAERLIWMVGENWRYAPTIRRAAEIIKSGALGDIALATWNVFAGITPDRPYYQTPWRHDRSHPAGFVLDGGVHQIATWRALLGEVVEVQAYTQHMRPDLPPPDTLSASLRFESGLIGSFGLTYAVGFPRSTALTIVGTGGLIEVNREMLTFTQGGEIKESLSGQSMGIEEQLSAFAAAIRNGQPHDNTPLNALQDVALIEALLAAAESGKPAAVKRLSK